MEKGRPALVGVVVGKESGEETEGKGNAGGVPTLPSSVQVLRCEGETEGLAPPPTSSLRVELLLFPFPINGKLDGVGRLRPTLRDLFRFFAELVVVVAAEEVVRWVPSMERLSLKEGFIDSSIRDAACSSSCCGGGGFS